MVNIGIRALSSPSPFAWISVEIGQHIFMNFFLQIYADGTVGTDNLIRTNAGFGRHVSSGIRNAYVSWVVSDRVTSTFNSSSSKFLKKLLARNGALNRQQHHS